MFTRALRARGVVETRGAFSCGMGIASLYLHLCCSCCIARPAPRDRAPRGGKLGRCLDGVFHAEFVSGLYRYCSGFELLEYHICLLFQVHDDTIRVGHLVVGNLYSLVCIVCKAYNCAGVLVYLMCFRLQHLEKAALLCAPYPMLPTITYPATQEAPP